MRRQTSREQLAEAIAARLDVPVTVAGVLLVLIVIADRSTPVGSPLGVVWTVGSWSLWALFVLEFVARMVVAPSTAEFLRRSWWQALFLVLPFLRFLRGLSRSARLARAVTTSVRGSRSAASNLGGRVGMLVSITFAVILAGTEVLVEFGDPTSYPHALHDVALGAISGEPIGGDSVVAAWLEVLLALHATVFFAALAGSMGAFFLQRQDEHARSARSGVSPQGRWPAEAP